MPIDYDPTILEAFFGSPGRVCDNPTEDTRALWFDYVGPTLKYAIILRSDAEVVNISGDLLLPFRGDSLYEIAVPCTAIVSGPDPYHPEQIFLTFLYGSDAHSLHRQMTVMKA